MVFFLFVVIMVISLGTIMYMVEGNVSDTQFKDIPTSSYWAVVTMTTVGYGDIAPVTRQIFKCHRNDAWLHHHGCTNRYC